MATAAVGVTVDADKTEKKMPDSHERVNLFDFIILISEHLTPCMQVPKVHAVIEKGVSTEYLEELHPKIRVCSPLAGAKGKQFLVECL